MTSRRERRRRQRRIIVHDELAEDLQDLLEEILPGQTIRDRAVAEAVLSLIGSTLRFVDEHAPDETGRCPTCRRRAPCPLDQLSPLRHRSRLGQTRA